MTTYQYDTWALEVEYFAIEGRVNFLTKQTIYFKTRLIKDTFYFQTRRDATAVGERLVATAEPEREMRYSVHKVSAYRSTKDSYAPGIEAIASAILKELR